MSRRCAKFYAPDKDVHEKKLTLDHENECTMVTLDCILKQKSIGVVGALSALVTKCTIVVAKK